MHTINLEICTLAKIDADRKKVRRLFQHGA
jgi:hypothetical protein